MIRIKYKYLNFSRALNFAAIQNSHWGLSLLLTEASSTSQNEKLCLLKVKCYLSFWLLKGGITLWKELKIFSFRFCHKNINEMITSYIHSESRPQLLEYLAEGFQTVGYKFSDIPCPNSGNYVNFWIKLSSVSGRKQVEACITNLVILYCKIWKQESKLTLNEYDIIYLSWLCLSYLFLVGYLQLYLFQKRPRIDTRVPKL